MKKSILSFLLILTVLLMGACNQAAENNETETVVSGAPSAEENAPSEKVQTTISGSFTVSVLALISDYMLSSETPNIAIVMEYQCYPFTIFVGEEIARQLEVGEVYVFTIKPFVVEQPKEYVEQLNLSSIVWEFSDFEITDFRLAQEEELGMESLYLTIE